MGSQWVASDATHAFVYGRKGPPLHQERLIHIFHDSCMGFGVFADWIASKPNSEFYVIGILIIWCFSYLSGNNKQTLQRKFIFWIIRVAFLVFYIELAAYVFAYIVENHNDDCYAGLFGLIAVTYFVLVSSSYITLLQAKGFVFTLENWDAPLQYHLFGWLFESLGWSEHDPEKSSERTKNWYKLVLDEESWNEIFNEEE